jgi:spermidine/putrescine-binding protein
MAYLEDFGKETYFNNHGYAWDARIQAYVSKADWKIFSKDYIDDHSFDALLVNFQEETVPNQWKIYFNTESPLDVHNVHKHYGVATGLDV